MGLEMVSGQPGRKGVDPGIQTTAAHYPIPASTQATTGRYSLSGILGSNLRYFNYTKYLTGVSLPVLGVGVSDGGAGWTTGPCKEDLIAPLVWRITTGTTDTSNHITLEYNKLITNIIE